MKKKIRTSKELNAMASDLLVDLLDKNLTYAETMCILHLASQMHNVKVTLAAFNDEKLRSLVGC